MSILSDLEQIKKFMRRNPRPKAIATWLQAHGWRYLNHGLYKDTFAKGRLVAKIPRVHKDKCASELDSRIEISEELRQYDAAEQLGLTHYLVKLYYSNKNLLIQERVEECDEGGCKEVRRIARHYPIWDYWHNHGHRANDQVVFYDYVGLDCALPCD